MKTIRILKPKKKKKSLKIQKNKEPEQNNKVVQKKAFKRLYKRNW